MTIRMITPADGSGSVILSWDYGGQVLQARQLIDVPPGSQLETAIGLANLADATALQLASAQNGGGGTGWVTN
jgi:hypothetical protein